MTDQQQTEKPSKPLMSDPTGVLSGRPALTYDQLSALCAQMAAALEFYGHANNHLDKKPEVEDGVRVGPPISSVQYDCGEKARTALTAYRTLSPDPQWQRVPEGCVVVPEEPDLTMCSAGKTAINPKLENAEGVPYARRVYRAMLAVRLNRARGEG